ncbi:antibiotic hydrolase [Acrocarpospora pleiomorpha]|uniref:Antibiotic hydrolase n=1 Tax=Acrocarpospora pleiomorpha TaxID=90975 RepID=A0A5M3XIC0_9ACTN|nr:CocE/NonD family hydrolase [Acrocarpospora pleiomorpha]GES19969.1 antibiotic hydrolase [Acrocarpospora pleiomorpha]
MTEAAYDVVVQRDVMLSMPDGIRLATDLYRPAALTGPRPVVLFRTPYNKRVKEADWAPYFAARGYVVAVQDCRGCYGSEGDVDFLWPEADDGRATLEWLVEQDFCDGRVVLRGTSWSGWAQTAVAAAGANGIAAMIPTMSGANAHESSVRHGGAVELRFIAWAFWHSAKNYRPQARPRSTDEALNDSPVLMSEWLHHLPLKRDVTQLSLVEPYERWMLDIATRADLDERWTHPSVNPLAHIAKFPDVPVMLVGGWYDSYTRATLQLFTALAEAKSAAVHAVIGPWVHGTKKVALSHAGDIDLGPQAALTDFQRLHLDWYDQHLFGHERGLGDSRRVKIFVMGGGTGHRLPSGRLDHGGRWLTTDRWPHPEATTTQLYLTANNRLDSEPPTTESAHRYTFDPRDPVPTIGGNVSSLYDLIPLSHQDRVAAVDNPDASRTTPIVHPGGFDQTPDDTVFGACRPHAPLAARSDVLVFQTPPLSEPLQVIGDITVTIWVSTDAPDTDFTAKLIDVYPPSSDYPNGYALNLTDSITRLRYRNGPEAAGYEPGIVIPVTITLYPTANLFARHHRLRLDISSSNFPRFDVNPNTGDPLWSNGRWELAHNTVHVGASTPSHIALTTVPAECQSS